MLSIIRRWPELHSVMTSKTNICGINPNNKILSFRPMSQHFRILKADNTGDLSTNNKKYFTITARSHSTLKTSNDARSEFLAVYPVVLQDLTLIADRCQSKEAVDWFRKAVEYNLTPTNGKCGQISVLTYKSLVKGDLLNAENLKLSYLLGWCVEMLHSIILIADDIVDNGTTRRGHLCWHKLEEVGLNAVNDLLIIENSIYELLKRHVRHLDCYVDLMELFHENTFKCISGQSLDMLLSKKNVNCFNMDIYNTLVMNKTSNHFFYLPIMLGLRLAGVKDKKIFDACEAITIELGHYFQVQNDFLDCFGSPDVTGKISTDIQANKCSWLVVVGMERASSEQRAIIEECYGQYDSQKVARVQQIYKELNLPGIYAKYEEEIYNKIETRIQQSSDALPREVFLEILNTISEKNIK